MSGWFGSDRLDFHFKLKENVPLARGEWQMLN